LLIILPKAKQHTAGWLAIRLKNISELKNDYRN